MMEAVVEKMTKEIKVEGADPLCDVFNFAFELKEKKFIQLERKETQSQTVTLRVWHLGRNCDIVVPRLAEPFVAEACQVAFTRLQRDPNIPKSLQAFRKLFENEIAEIFRKQFTEVKVFDGKKPTKIQLELVGVLCGCQAQFQVNAKSIRNEEKYFWDKYFGWDYERAKRIFDLLVRFCESVGRPRVFQVRNFAKALVEQKS